MSIACNSTSLVSGAACLECGIPPGMQDAVAILLLCQIANTGLNPINTASYPLTDGTPLNVSFAHGLGHTPTVLRGVLLCTANDSRSGVFAGQEVDINQTFDFANNGEPLFGYGADSTKIYLSYDGNAAGFTEMDMSWQGKPNAIVGSFTNFSFKVYYK